MNPRRPAWIHAALLLLPITLLAALFLLLGTTARAGGQGLPFQLTTTEPGRGTGETSISFDGRRVAFVSDADYLGQGVTGEADDVWLIDTQTLSYTRVTTASAPDRNSNTARISPDGRYVVFRSDSDLLDQGIQHRRWEIWLYDSLLVTYTRVTSSTAADRASYQPSVSANGRYVAFYSDNDFFNQGMVNNQYEIWLYDTQQVTYTRVTSGTAGSWHPRISADGKVIAFYGSADLLDQGLPRYQDEIWLYDTTTLTYTRVTSASHPERDSSKPKLSAAGRFVVFQSDSDILGQGIPDDQQEIWLYDRATMAFTRVTSATGSGDRKSEDPEISLDSNVVVFKSDSDFYSEGIPEDQDEIWSWDRRSGVLSRLTFAISGTRAVDPSVNLDGRFVAYRSDHNPWDPTDIDNSWEVWLNRPAESVYLPLAQKAD